MLNLQAVVSLNHGPFQSGLSTIGTLARNTSGALAAAFGGVTTEILAMSAAFGPMGAAIGVLKQATEVGAGFEQAMANVRSVTGLAAEDMTKVGEAARTMAKETRYTATQSADALYALGSAGISTADDLINALQPSLLLAGATASSTALATETMTAALAAFQMSSSEATHIADLFAGVISASPATMERLAYAMEYAGTAGAAFGMNIADVVKEIGAFHLVGLRGEMAGTSFRMALIDLAAAAESGKGKVGAAMQGWAADTDGLTGAVKRLEAAGLTGAEVISELGARSGSGMAGLLALGSKAIDELGVKILANADVVRMYDIQMDTLSGRFDNFTSALEEVGQKLFVLMAPALKAVTEWATMAANAIIPVVENLWRLASGAIPAAQQAIGFVVDKFADLLNAWNGLPDFAKAFIVLVPAVMAVTSAFSTLLPAVAAFGVMIVKVSASAVSAFIGSFVLPALSSLAVLSAALLGFSWGQVLANMKAGTDTVGGHLTQFFAWLMLEVDHFTAEFSNNWSQWVEYLKIVILENMPGIVETLAKHLGAMVKNVGEFSAWVTEQLGMEDAAAAMRKRTEEMAATLKAFDSTVSLEKARAELARLRAEANDIDTQNLEKMDALFQELGEDAQENLQGAIDPLEVFGAWLEKVRENGDAMWQMIVSGSEKGKELLGAAALKAQEFAAGLLTVEGAAGAAGAGIGGAGGTLPPVIDKLASAGDVAKKAAEGFGELAEGAVKMGIGFDATSSQAAQFSRAVDVLDPALRKLSAAGALNMPDMTKLDIPSVTASQANQFGRAVDVLVPALAKLRPFAGVVLPDMSKLNLPHWSKTAANNFAEAVNVVEPALRKLAAIGAINITVAEVTPALISGWKELAEIIGKINFGNAATPVNSVAGKLDRLAATLGETNGLLGRIVDAKGVIWA